MPNPALIGHSPLHRCIFAFLVRSPPIEEVIPRLTPQQLVNNRHLERHTPRVLREWGMTAVCGLWAGLGVMQLHEAGYTPKQLRVAGINWVNLLPLYEMSDLKRDGMTAREGIAAGLSPTQLWHGGYTVKQLKSGGVSWARLFPLVGDVSIMKAAGMRISDGIAAGITRIALRDGGYSPKDFRSTGTNVSWADLLTLFDVPSLRRAGMTATQGKNVAQLTLTQLRDYGYSARELLHMLSARAAPSTSLKTGDRVEALWKGGKAGFKGYYKAIIRKVTEPLFLTQK